MIEIGLHGATAFDGYLPAHQVAHSLDDGALHHVHRRCRIHDLAADIAGHPNFAHLHLAVGVHADFRDLGKVSAMSKLESDAESSAGREGARTPSRFFSGKLQNATHPARVEIGLRGVGLGAHDSWCRQ